MLHKDLGPQVIEDEDALFGVELTLDEFETGFPAPGGGIVYVRLDAQTPQAKKHFDDWWAELSKRHPGEAAVSEGQTDTVPHDKLRERRRRMVDVRPNKTSWTYRAREAVGVFTDPDALEEAVNQLEVAGFDRATISVLGSDKAIKERVGHLYRSVAEIEDDGRVPETAFASKEARAEGETAAVAVPFYVGGLAGAAAVVATGGALAAAIAGTIIGGAAGAGLGALLALSVARHHAKRIEGQLGQGGLILWIGVSDQDAEKRAVAVLEKNGAKHVHVHEIERNWGPKDRPLSDAQLDPLLFERDAIE
jgi:hypothetical protein